MSVKFRLAQVSDQATIIAIYNQAVATKGSTADLTPVTVAQRQAWFAAFTPDHFPLWVIESDGACAGFVGLEPYSDRAGYRNTAEIAIYLDAQYRGHHLGTQAIDWVAQQAPKLGVTTVISRIFGHNQASRHLFEQSGYEHWGHLPAIADMQGFTADLEVYGRHF
ncbi:GNAT family N-acetyltransferase [Levilactobacillus tujiorum]|uniref:GNAT family N-acetyltransferase n=1 Tax=Levilactobacillus tujiorum TaxID=2912243 RepID=UPI00145674EC|nr:GNAT family N-acetyltransferase [Levilactobacillus tujiorum]NLR31542.1 N-acetyltransferase [Levilactobacillus tujiorum]